MRRRRADARLRHQPGPQAEGRRPAVEGPRRACMKSRKITIVAGTGVYRGDGTVEVDGRGRLDRRCEADARHPRRRLGAPHDPRLRRRRPLRVTSDEVLSMTELPASAAVIGGGAIGCEFASMMADLGVQVTVLEALPKILPGLRRRRRQRRRPLVQEAGHRRPHRREGHRPRARASRPTTVQHRAAASTLDGRRWSSCRSAAARCPRRLGLDGTGVEVDERGFVQGRRDVPHRRCRRRVRGRRPDRHARSWPTSGFAEAIVAIKDILGEDAGAGRLRQGAVGHLLPPRGRLRRPLRGARPRRPASTSSCRSTVPRATAGP